MKKRIIHLSILKMHDMGRHMCSVTIIFLLALLSTDLSSQCAQRSMACNNLLHLALDDSCRAVVTPQMILEDMVGVPSDYELRIFDPQGNRIIGNVLRDDYDCKRLKVEVECRQSRIYCWGYIIVEDKVKPTLIISPTDTAVYCSDYDFNLQPNSMPTRVIFSDQGSCERPDSLGIISIKYYPKDNCSDTVQVVERFWQVVDKSKYRNDSTVLQRIHLLRPSFSQFYFPKDTVVECGSYYDLSIAKLGQPELRSCRDFFDVILSEIEFPGVCGAARKISRSWRIYDICRGRDTTVYQTIEVIDTTAPVIDFDGFKIPYDRFVTSKESCTATARHIPNPTITDCSTVEADQLKVFYQYVDDSGIPYGRRYDAVVNYRATFDLVDVSIGQPFLVIFEATDSCGNTSIGERGPFTADDTAEPNAVCEKTTIVSINNTGFTEVTAQSLDDYSYDNCGIVKKVIRRLDGACEGFEADLEFGSSVHFCCVDVAANPIKVQLRVYDSYGNYSDCTIDVIVQDKRVPVISCKKNIELDCSFDLNTLEDYLKQKDNLPVVEWVCSPGSIVPTYDSVSVSKCGYGAFSVTWIATDGNGARSTCTQHVTIDNRTGVEITPPQEEIVINDCNGGIEPTDIGGAPVVHNVDCEDIFTSHEDTPFEILYDPTDSDLCRKISRTWVIINWCKFDGSNVESAVIGRYTQIIKIKDSGDPVFSNELEDFEVIDVDKDCKQRVSISVNATDNCTDAANLTYTYTIDTDQDGDVDISGSGHQFDNELPVGTYHITFTVEDECGNLDQTSASFEVIPSKAPIPLFDGYYPAEIQSNGRVTILASSVNKKSTNGCGTSEEGLIFAFSSDPDDITKTFSCSDVSDGVKAKIPVKVFVIDAWGNYNSSTVIIELSDSDQNACIDSIASSISVQGEVVSEGKAAVANIAVNAYNTVTQQLVTVMTDKKGRYELTGLTAYDKYRVEPVISGYDDTGLSTYDILLIQKHILGIKALDSPYKIIAADVNGSQSLSAADIVAIKRLLLGKVDKLDEPWRFVKADSDIDMDNPWNYPSDVELYDLNSDIEQLNFIGIKTGDVSGNAFGALVGAQAGVRSMTGLSYRVEQSDDIVTYTISADDDQSVAGMQMALSYADDMELLSIAGGAIDLQDDMIADHGDHLRISWTGKEVLRADEPALTLTFRGHHAHDLRLRADLLSPELYTTEMEAKKVMLRQATTQSAGLKLLANTPNPFSEETRIHFVVPTEGAVELTISDISGRVVYTSTKIYSAGEHSVPVSADKLPDAGVYYYTVMTHDEIATRPMVVLK